MNTQVTNTNLKEAEEHFDAAWEEMARPEEDVVVYGVCKHALRSVKCSLTGLLQRYGVPFVNTTPVETLIKEARKVDTRFNDLDLTLFIKFENPEDVYMNVSLAKEHVDLAKRTMELARS